MADKIAERKKWMEDAGSITNYDDFDRIVYRNGIIDDYLYDDSKHFIIAGKGVGKTLLLTYKRYLMENRYMNDQGNLTVTFVPKEKPYVDFIQNITTTLSNAQHNRLKSWEYCKRLWMSIIELSAISFSTIDISLFLESLPARAERHKNILGGLVKTPRTIEYIFNEILAMGETGMIHFLDDVSNSVGEAFKSIHNGIYFFFDRIDQTLESSHSDIWISIQAGLLEAAWDIMRSNHHIKLFLSIRQEAYAAHKSKNAHAISGEVSKIEYTDKELRELLDYLVSYYEGKEKVEKFLEREYFYNTTVRHNEPVFSFMNRYSLGRPRDFVNFCNELSSALKGRYKNNTKKGFALKNTIIHASSFSIVKNIHAEVHMLLNCLKTNEEFDRFLVLIDNNILTYNEMQNVCKTYNGSSCSCDCDSCLNDNHPFCDLYNMGLLGKIDVDSATNQQIQKFKSPYENMISGMRADSAFFFIHPALRNYLNELHSNTKYGDGYHLLDDLLIGDGLPWNDKHTKITKINKLIMLLKNENAKEFFSKQRHEFAFKKSYLFSFDKCAEACKYCEDDERKTIDSLIELLNKGRKQPERKVSVFVSYAWEDAAHKDNVESFTDMLRGKGFDAMMDSSLKLKYPDLDMMMTKGLGCDKIVIVLSENYKKRADDHEGGVWREFKMIADELDANPQKFVFVSFKVFSDNLKRRISPRAIGNRYIVDLCKGRSNDYNELISFLTDEDDITFNRVNLKTQSVRKKAIKPFDK